MKLHEFQSKAILGRFGIPVPRGEVAGSAEEAGAIAGRLGGRVAVKAQVLVGGRGKAGGIRVAATPAEAREKAAAILGLTIRGLPVTRLLIEEAAEIAREIYLGLVIDRVAGRVALMASAQGGVEIEEVARTHPEQIARLAIDPLEGLRDYQTRYLASFLSLPAGLWPSFARIAHGLYSAFVESDASLAEINPLVVTGAGELLALDAKINLDDNALYRHADLEALRNSDEESLAEARARAAGLSYVGLDGNIGCMVNGAGLAMATLDAIKAFGGMPANFLDIGGGARSERVATALDIILQEPRVSVVLLNIFGGITRCDEVAQGVAEALGHVRPDLPIVARLVGTNEAEGQAILAQAGGIRATTSLAQAAQLAVAAAGRGN
ncbi:MAG TPA: ADP-forming succinate--CoA ligase subunit beta [Anaerolineae bacterium]|nr:ADP-forming succinate--CoA ligase subunit beta [Anaerolineae bacterium]HPL28557.1 ADP-forming succinate--CoA ligase subunit beta [Anaerolineae bacterium]